MIHIELRYFMVIFLMWDTIFATLLFHWGMGIGIKNLTRKVKWLASAGFIVIYFALRFFVISTTLHRESNFWLLIVDAIANVLRAMSTLGVFLALVLLVYFFIKVIKKVLTKIKGRTTKP
ncbi:MAG: hypothetical protein FWE21_00645 [Defluviitaleaceae bacterium]|nr:hypothetical protein [Defluviitaleaceae bacterium]